MAETLGLALRICNQVKLHMVYSKLHAKFGVSSAYDSWDLCVYTYKHGLIDSSRDADQEYITYICFVGRKNMKSKRSKWRRRNKRKRKRDDFPTSFSHIQFCMNSVFQQRLEMSLKIVSSDCFGFLILSPPRAGICQRVQHVTRLIASV